MEWTDGMEWTEWDGMDGCDGMDLMESMEWNGRDGMDGMEDEMEWNVMEDGCDGRRGWETKTGMGDEMDGS